MSASTNLMRDEDAPGGRGPAHGLVEQVTSRTREYRNGTNEFRRSHVYRLLNRERRVRRMRRVVIRSAEVSRLGIERSGGRHHAVLITLTYRPGVLWTGRHMSAFCACLRVWLDRHGVARRYQWVMELQKSGVPHYHLLLWLPKRLQLPKPDKAGWWRHGFSRIERARSAVGYLVKYASKGLGDPSSGEIPAGARLFGCANAADERHDVKRARLPIWLERQTDYEQLPRRLAFRGFVCERTGRVYRSPYRLDVVRGPDGRWVVVITERY